MPSNNPQPNKPTLIYLEWCDAIASGLEWTDAEVAKEWGDKSQWVVRECGWLLQETPKYLSHCFGLEDRRRTL